MVQGVHTEYILFILVSILVGRTCESYLNPVLSANIGLLEPNSKFCLFPRILILEYVLVFRFFSIFSDCYLFNGYLDMLVHACSRNKYRVLSKHFIYFNNNTKVYQVFTLILRFCIECIKWCYPEVPS